MPIAQHGGLRYTHTHTHTHTTVLLLFWILSGTTQVSRYQKGNTNLDLLEQEIVSGSGICWGPYANLHLTPDNHANILQAGCPSCHPTNSVKALKVPRKILGKLLILAAT